MSRYSRRDFLKGGAAASALAGIGNLPLPAETKTATGWVTLGKSGVQVTRLAFGTGTFSGEVQRNLGQEGLTRLVRHAYDRGIRFFETAESYQNMHHMLGVALQGIPRDSYRLMTKIETGNDSDPRQKIDALRKAANTDYFDIMLLHYQHTGTWPEDTVRWQDAIVEAQHQHAVIGRGASVHGLPALRRMPSFNWLDIAMIRCNHKGTRMDGEVADAPAPGDVDEVVSHIHQCRAAGMGVISMKLVGEGVFDREDRRKAMRFAFRNAHVNSVTVGYRRTEEIDEAIDNLNLALA
jgi:aryl-alcohol dehydrogenase-like predicted oxidoreductase